MSVTINSDEWSLLTGACGQVDGEGRAGRGRVGGQRDVLHGHGHAGLPCSHPRVNEPSRVKPQIQAGAAVGQIHKGCALNPHKEGNTRKRVRTRNFARVDQTVTLSVSQPRHSLRLCGRTSDSMRGVGISFFTTTSLGRCTQSFLAVPTCTNTSFRIHAYDGMNLPVSGSRLGRMLTPTATYHNLAI